MQENCKKGTCAYLVCSKAIVAPKRTYCSWDCRVKHGLELRTHTCSYCSIVFITKPDNTKKKDSLHYCSSACRTSWYSGKNNHSWRGVKEERVCLTCKNVFVIRKTSQKTRLYCNKICKSKRIKVKPLITMQCGFCNIVFTKKKITGGFKYCGKECASKAHSIKMRSKNNPNYTHGNANIRYPLEWNKNFKKLIRQRDNYQCQLCNMDEARHGKKLCVHHIDFDRFNLSLDNLITLCKYCHGKFHGKNTRDKCKEELLNLLKEKNKSLIMFIT